MRRRRADVQGDKQFKLGLREQGIFLVSVLLVLEFVFVGTLWLQLQQAEVEAVRQERWREVVVNTNRLIEINYVTIYALKDFIETRDDFHLKKCHRSIEEASELIAWLEENLADHPYQKELVEKIETKTRQAAAIVDTALLALSAQQSPVELKRLIDQESDVYSINRKMVPLFQELIRAQRHLERESPDRQRQLRRRTLELILGGLVVNVILAFAMSLYFVRTISSRLSVVVDNTDRLKRGQPLLPAVGGEDEIAALDGAFRGMAKELTESINKERQALDESRQAESRVRSIIDSMPVGIFVTDGSGMVLFVNPSAEQMFEYDGGDLKGAKIASLIRHGLLSEPEPMEALARAASADSLEIKGARKSGDEFDLDLSVIRFDRAEERRYLALMVDVTEKLEVQRMRQRFVAMVSHELRTPLSSVQSYLELVEMGAFGELPEEARTGAARSLVNVERLIGLINDLLELEKMESGALSIRPEKTALIDLVKESVAAVSDVAAKKKIEITTGSELGSLSLFCDRARIIQVLVNLLGNAVKFSPPGSAVAVDGREDGGSIEVSVIDRGPGVPARFQAVIFERFQQLQPSADETAGGAGLGLAICKAIVEGHGGTIGVESRADSASGAAAGRSDGSRFWFRLPPEPET